MFTEKKKKKHAKGKNEETGDRKTLTRIVMAEVTSVLAEMTLGVNGLKNDSQKQNSADGFALLRQSHGPQAGLGPAL